MNIFYRYVNTFLVTILILASASLASAHLDAGSEVVVNNYLIDLGYSPASPNTDNATFINFNFLDNKTQKLVSPTSVWVRISKDNKTEFSGSYASIDGNTGFLYTFANYGNYELYIKFYNNSQVLADNKFNFNVYEGNIAIEKNTPMRMIIIELGIVVLIILLLFIVLYLHRYQLHKKYIKK